MRQPRLHRSNRLIGIKPSQRISEPQTSESQAKRLRPSEPSDDEDYEPLLDINWPDDRGSVLVILLSIISKIKSTNYYRKGC